MSDNKLPQDSQTVFIPVTGKQLGIAIIAILTMVGGPPVLNRLTPDVRNDPYTGTQGAAIDKRVSAIEEARDANEDKLETFDLQISLLQHDRDECRNRGDATRSMISGHIIYSANKVEEISKQFSLVETKASINERLIGQCLRATQ